MNLPAPQELHAFNERWNRAWLEKDDATVDRLMAEDYVYVAPSGMTLDRQAILRIIRSPNYKLELSTRTVVAVRPLGQQAAVVRLRFQAAGSFEESSFTDDFKGVTVCEKREGEWRIVMEQCSFNGK